MDKINVLSFDFDGCIFNRSYRKSPKKYRDLIEANQSFIKTVSKQIHQRNFSRVIFRVGSNRQSRDTDMENSLFNKTHSCFIALKQLSSKFKKQDVQCEVDGYLLADSYGNQLEGKNFENYVLVYKQAKLEPTELAIFKAYELMNEIAKKKGYFFSNFVFDETKLNILYAQMHRAASQNLHSNIIYDFYDDQNEILVTLQSFFKENSDLIPRNLRLGLHQYAGETITLLADIQGSGPIDYNYAYNIKKMVVDTGLCKDTILKEPYKKEHDIHEKKQIKRIICSFNEDKACLTYFKGSRDTEAKPSVCSTAKLQVSFLAKQKLSEQQEELVQRRSPNLR